MDVHALCNVEDANGIVPELLKKRYTATRYDYFTLDDRKY